MDGVSGSDDVVNSRLINIRAYRFRRLRLMLHMIHTGIWMSAASQARATGAIQNSEAGRMIAPITARINMPTVRKRKIAPMVRWNFRWPFEAFIGVGA